MPRKAAAHKAASARYQYFQVLSDPVIHEGYTFLEEIGLKAHFP